MSLTAGGEFISKKLMAILPMGTRRSVGERIVANPDKHLKDGKGADRYDLENLSKFYRQGATQLLINLWKKTELHGVI